MMILRMIFRSELLMNRDGSAIPVIMRNALGLGVQLGRLERSATTKYERSNKHYQENDKKDLGDRCCRSSNTCES